MGKINNPGRYLVLLPPINGATAVSAHQSPYFTGNPGDPFKAWDMSVTYDYMPKQCITFRWEYDYRARECAVLDGPGRNYASAGRVPYTNNGFPHSSLATTGIRPCTLTQGRANRLRSAGSSVWFPDLRRESRWSTSSIMVKFCS